MIALWFADALAQDPTPAPAEAPVEAPAEAPAEAPVEAPPEVPVAKSRTLVVDRIAAVVNDEVIALSEVYELGRDFVIERCPELDGPCTAGAELEVLDALIRRTLIHQQLTELQLDVTAADIDRAIDGTVQQYQLPDRAALRAEVEASGTRWDQYRAEFTEVLRTQAFQGRVLAPRVSVSEDELRNLYNRTLRDVTKPVVKVSGIGIAIPPGSTPEEDAQISAQAVELARRLAAGEIGWDQAVTDYDDGAAAMFAGQEFDETQLLDPIRGVVFAAPTGVVQGPVRMASGSGLDVLFLLRVDEKSTRSDVAPFEDVKAQLQEQVFQEKLQEAEEEWYQRARREAAIDVKIQA